MKTVFLASALVVALGGAASAQFNGPVNPGSGPTAGGVVNEGAVNGRPLFQEGRGTRSDALTTGSILPGFERNGAGPSAGGTIGQTAPVRR